MRAAGIALIVALVATPAAAQQPPIRLTLDEALARGVQASQRLAEMQARLEAAEAAEAGRRAAEQPSLALQGGYTRTNHVDEFIIAQPGQPPRVLYPDIPDNVRARLDLQWPIYTGGRGDALVRAARAERDAAGADLAASRADLRLEIARAFWALVTADDTASVLDASLRSMDAHVRDLAVRLEQGLIPPNELLSAQAQQSRQRMLAIEARNTRAITEADLRRLLGVDGDERIEPDVALDGPRDTAVPVERLAADARGQRPERRALEQRASAAQSREDAVASASRPQLAVTAGYDYARPNPRIFPRSGAWHDSWDVSINATWLLWDGGRRAAERAEAAAVTRAAETRVREFDRLVAFEVRQRWLEVDSSRAAIAAAEDGVRAAVEARRVVGERYTAGVATSTDVLDAETAVLQAQLDRTRAVANARLAEARLRRAVGQ
jgi:outer membrane protein TolC